MTAEVAVMNKEAVALAADSAVTLSFGRNRKVFISANKIFALSKVHPVGMMIYGNTDFMDAPLETIIKIYRGKEGGRPFPILPDYLDDFVTFLKSQQWLKTEAAQESQVMSTVWTLYRLIGREITKKIGELLDAGETLNDDTIGSLATQDIAERHTAWSEEPLLEGFDDNRVAHVRNAYHDMISDLASAMFGHPAISSDTINQLVDIGVHVCTKWPEGHLPSLYSGIVVAGFGDDDVFPRLRSVWVDGIIADQLRIKHDADHDVGTDGGCVNAFAQGDMVQMFMEGVDPDYERVIEATIGTILDKYPGVLLDCIPGIDEDTKAELLQTLADIGGKTLEESGNKLRKHRRDYFVDPIITVVAFLPKDELAEMAESLVSLTSLKRKVSPAQETVAGPTDVAIISKGDGLIWVKRKHYFKPELNWRFFQTYLRGLQKAKEGVENGRDETA